MSILLVTDGSCSSDNLLGSWGAVISTVESARVLYGSAYPTTLSRCELLPIIEGLRVIYYEIAKRQSVAVKLVSDSEYTIKTINGFYLPGKNGDLWDAYKFYSKKLRIEAIWRERNSHPYMEICDSLAHAVRVTVKDELYSGIIEKQQMLPLLGPETI